MSEKQETSQSTDLNIQAPSSETTQQQQQQQQQLANGMSLCKT